MSAVVDHKGNKFATMTQMCAFWGIPTPTYCFRIKHKWTQEQALETAPGKTKEPIFDHLGNTYKSFSDLCCAYGKPLDTVRFRLDNGWDMKSALTTPIKSTAVSAKNACKDHLQHSYGSFSEMCAAYGKCRSLVKYRLSHGWSLERALTTDAQQRKK